MGSLTSSSASASTSTYVAPIVFNGANIDASLVTLTSSQIAQLPNAPSVPNPLPTTIGTYYFFQQAGASIPNHAHADTNVHYTAVLSGQFTIVRDSVVGPVTANPGDVLAFAVGENHSITCTVPGAILNGLMWGPGIGSISADLAVLQAQASSLSTTVASVMTAVQSLQQELTTVVNQNPGGVNTFPQPVCP